MKTQPLNHEHYIDPDRSCISLNHRPISRLILIQWKKIIQGGMLLKMKIIVFHSHAKSQARCDGLVVRAPAAWPKGWGFKSQMRHAKHIFFSSGISRVNIRDFFKVCASATCMHLHVGECGCGCGGVGVWGCFFFFSFMGIKVSDLVHTFWYI